MQGAADFTNASPELITAMMNEAGIAFTNGTAAWVQGEMNLVLQGIVALANKISNFNNETGLIQLHQLLGGELTTFHRMAGDTFFGAAAWVGGGQVLQGPELGEHNRIVKVHNAFFSSADYARGATAHELAHVIDFNANPFKDLSNNMPFSPVFNAGGHAAAGGSTEYFAEVTALWVYEPANAAGNNPYRLALGLPPRSNRIPPLGRLFLEDRLGSR